LKSPIKIKNLVFAAAISISLSVVAVGDCLGKETAVPAPEASASENKMTKLPDGTWAGPGVVLVVNDKSALLEFDCAHGEIAPPLEIDGEGNFRWQGSHEMENGGPVQISSTEDGKRSAEQTRPKAMAVRYEGTVVGSTMRLSIVAGETGKILGTFQLVLGQLPHLNKCL
jgi:hypothetical protein